MKQLLSILLTFIFAGCGVFSTLGNWSPSYGNQYYVVKHEIKQLEQECRSKHSWGLASRGRRLQQIDVAKICEAETAMRWRFYDWTQCWNAHLDDGLRDRCGVKPQLPEVGE